MLLKINLHAEGKYEEIIFYYAQDGGGREMLSGEVEKIRISKLDRNDSVEFHLQIESLWEFSIISNACENVFVELPRNFYSFDSKLSV